MTPNGRLRLVLDTNVLVAAVRSRTGASSALMTALGDQSFAMPASTPLMLEYEAVLTRSEHLAASGRSAAAALADLDGGRTLAQPVQIHYRWRPRLPDPAGELVLEAAVNGRADAIVTFNTSHFAAAVSFGIELGTPGQMLRRISR